MYGEIRPSYLASGVRYCTLCGQQLAQGFLCIETVVQTCLKLTNHRA